MKKKSLLLIGMATAKKKFSAPTLDENKKYKLIFPVSNIQIINKISL